jgi:aubergine-like protein
LGQQIRVHSNSFAIPFQRLDFVYRYLVTFLPEIQQEQVSLRKKALGYFRTHLENHFGGFYVYDGMHIISLTQKENVVFEQTHDGRAMSIILEHNRNIKTSDVETQEVQVVVNVMLKRLFSELDLLNFERSYFDPKPRAIQGLNNEQIKVYSGFSFTVVPTMTGLQACVALAHKVVQSMTVRQFMMEIERDVRNEMRGRNEQEIRDRIIIQTNEQLTGSVVSLSYDKRAYKIHKVDFSRTLAHSFDLSTGEKITFRDYFKSHWRASLTDENRPGLLVHCRARKTTKGKTWREIPTGKEFDKDNIYLIPDLCHLTGLTEEMAGNFKLMSELAKVMRKPADTRIRMIQDHVRNILTSPKAAAKLKQLPLEISPTETISMGRMLPLVSVSFDRGKTKVCDRNRPS